MTRERERERERQRQRDRQTDRQTELDRDRQRQRGPEREKHTHTHTHTQITDTWFSVKATDPHTRREWRAGGERILHFSTVFDDLTRERERERERAPNRFTHMSLAMFAIACDLTVAPNCMIKSTKSSTCLSVHSHFIYVQGAWGWQCHARAQEPCVKVEVDVLGSRP